MNHCAGCRGLSRDDELVDVELDGQGVAFCQRCADDLALENHGWDCECPACERAEARWQRELMQREALTRGGLKSGVFSLADLGIEED